MRIETRNGPRLQQRAYALEIRDVEADGTFEGYGSVFGTVNFYNEIILPGAFKASLREWRTKKRLPPMLWQHDSTHPIGVYDAMEEDEKGLRVRGRLLKDAIAKAGEAYALLKERAIGGLSIGFRTVQEDDKDGIRRVKKAELWEVSLVTFPAEPNAAIDTVHSAPFEGRLPTLPEFERFLRDAGLSKSQACAIASRGLRELLRSESGESDLVTDLLSAIKTAPLTT